MRACRYRLAAACDWPGFATARDAFPFAGALQKLRCGLLADLGEIQDNNVSIWIHEFGITMHDHFASHNP